MDWVKHLLARGIPDVEAGMAEGLRQSFTFGVTTVGDITAFPRRSRALLTGCPRVVSFGEVRAMAGRRHLLEERLRRRWPGLARSAFRRTRAYSIEIEGYQRALEASREHNLPLTTHLAETPDEGEFLARHSGPLRELWEAIGGWDDQVPTFAGGPIRFAESVGLLSYPRSSLAHVNYCDDAELDLLAGGKASVIYCPRTHRYFNHPPHRWREMLARGINVAVGTDSCASSPDVNLVDDLRLLHQIAPDVSASRLWEMATIRSAKAIARDDRVGSLTIGKCGFCHL